MATQDDHHILESKFKLLETGRKMYFEDSQQQLKSMKEAVNSLRKENKELKKSLRAVQDEKKAEKENIPGSMQDKEIRQIDGRIMQVRKQLDQAKHENETKSSQLNRIKEGLRDVDLIKPDVLDLDPGLARKIRMLENRLDKSMIKYNEAQAIRKTYEQIVKRLKEERIGFDNQLAAIERTLKAKDHDYQELLAMSHDANHANAISKAELAQFRAAYEEERRQKDIELSERKAAVQRRIDQTQKLERKEKLLKARETEDAAPKQEEERPKQQVIEPAPEEQERLKQYEEAFAKIKDATGVADVQEVIQKFITQEDTHRNLVEMKERSQEKIDTLTVEKANMRAKLEELKYSGSGQLGSRRIVDEFETHLTEARHQCEKNRLKYERAAKLLINVKAGIEHLGEKLSDYKVKGEPERDEKMLQREAKDESIVTVMELCHRKLQNLADEVGSSLSEADALQPYNAMAVLPNTNRRIKLPASDDDDDGAEDDDEDEEEDVLDRETVKKLANLAVEREKKKSKKRGKKNKE
ncbi:Outer dynein arm protein 1 [Diplonema papillatum]|nr:Outer dynein arm protein 1 [Diplonema papillatum]